MDSKRKIGVLTLGCAKNLVDSERLLRQFEINGIEVVDYTEYPDILIINTCGFIENAKKESIDEILNAVELKRRGRLNKIIVIGCLSERYKIELQKEIPEIDAFYGTEKYEEILRLYSLELNNNCFHERKIFGKVHSSYLKISEGCNRSCSFCVIPQIRGKYKSRSIESLLNEAQYLAEVGVRELNIIAQDTTYYGVDLYGKPRLAELLIKLAAIDNLKWIRLLYAYPSNFPEDVIDVISENDKICKYIDIPLQHISDRVLTSMKRGIKSGEISKLIDKFRKRVNGIAIRSAFIVGYPNETEVEFRELIDFIREYELDRVGVFTYSQEENSHSFNLGDPIPSKIKEERKSEIMKLQSEISFKKNSLKIGKKITVLVDEIEKDCYIARTEWDAPEVDCETILDCGDKLNIGGFYEAEIYDCSEFEFYAKTKSK